MTTLLISPRYTEDSIAIRQAALALGWTVRRLPSWRPTEDLVAVDAVAYGEPLFVASVCEFLNLVPLEPTFDWLAKLDLTYTKRKVVFAQLQEARNTAGPAFIKPADDKCFKAMVYERPANLPGPELLPDATPTLVSEPVQWSIEFRAFISERMVRTISPYLRNGTFVRAEDGSWPANENELGGALEFLSKFLADDRVKLPPGVVVDVGLIEGRGWAIVEANPCWGSGIYGCDPEEVCKVVRAAIKLRSSLSTSDRDWVLARVPLCTSS